MKHRMPGLLADANVQGHLAYLTGQLQAEQLLELLADCGIVFATFADVGLDRGVDDRQLWRFCQDNRGFCSPTTATKRARIRSMR